MRFPSLEDATKEGVEHWFCIPFLGPMWVFSGLRKGLWRFVLIGLSLKLLGLACAREGLISRSESTSKSAPKPWVPRALFDLFEVPRSPSGPFMALV